MKEAARRPQSPLVGVRVVKGVELRMIGHDEHVEIMRPGVDQLVGLTRRMDPDVAGAHGHPFGADAYDSLAGPDQEELPLGEVGVVGTNSGAGRDPPFLHVEGMTAAPSANILNTAEGEGEVATERMKPARGRALFKPCQGGPGEGVHREER